MKIEMPKTVHEVWSASLAAEVNRPKLDVKALMDKIAATEAEYRKALIAEQLRRNALTPEQRAVEDVTKALEDPPPRQAPEDLVYRAPRMGMSVMRPESLGVIHVDPGC